METEFNASIKHASNKRTASGDSTPRLVLEVSPECIDKIPHIVAMSLLEENNGFKINVKLSV